MPTVAPDASWLAHTRHAAARPLAVALSTVLARTLHMTTLSGALDRLGSFLARTLGRTTTIVIGFAMTIAGLGMTATIVLLPLGMVTGLLGVAVFLGGTFAPDRTIDR